LVNGSDDARWVYYRFFAQGQVEQNLAPIAAYSPGQLTLLYLTIPPNRCIIYTFNGKCDRRCRVSQKEKVTLTLPTEVMDAVREEAEPRGYSKFIAEAVTYYIQEQRRSALRERLIAGYQGSAERDQALAEEWRHAEEGVWRETVEPTEQSE
jgi:hypothetical protein